MLIYHEYWEIWERGGQVTEIMKAAIFSKVWHPYMHIYATTDAVTNIKIIDISLLTAKRQISSQNTTYNARYNFLWKPCITVNIQHSKIQNYFYTAPNEIKTHSI